MEKLFEVQASATDQCICMDPQCGRDCFDSQLVGTDQRYGEVELWTCKLCTTTWLHYHLEYEAFTGSGRWYRGIIPAETNVDAHHAVKQLEHLPWYFYGGSYFKTAGMRGAGLVQVSA